MEKTGEPSIEQLEFLIESNKGIVDACKEEISLYKGVALGLFYGVIGNIIISHYYGLLEMLSFGRIDSLFWVNLCVTIVAVVFVIEISRRWHHYTEFA